MSELHALSAQPAAPSRALPTPALPYDEALAEQYALLLESRDFVVLLAREFHAIGLINGYYSAGAISTSLRGWDTRNMQRQAETIRIRMLEENSRHQDTTTSRDSLLIAALYTGLSAAIIERLT